MSTCSVLGRHKQHIVLLYREFESPIPSLWCFTCVAMDALPQWLRKSEPKPRFWASFQRLFIPSLHLVHPEITVGGGEEGLAVFLTWPPCLFGSTADRPGLSSFSGQRRGAPPISGAKLASILGQLPVVLSPVLVWFGV